jgi:predicted DNA-binding helix-hairpin-helix protein
MPSVISRPGVQEKLEILSSDAQYDLACACGSSKEEHRRRGPKGRWIYPVTLPNGGKSTLFKTLISNVCTNDCKYCPLREQQDIRRCSLRPEETVRIFWDYYNRGEVFGLFLSSAISGDADLTMEKLNTTAKILRRRYNYRGYIHLKVIPGASDAAIEEAVSLASAVSLNIETPGEKRLAKISQKKDYVRDIIEPMKLISRLTGRGSRYSRVKQTTQFIVGAAGETDSEIVKYMAGLYNRLGMDRVYFSAYQRDLGDDSIADDCAQVDKPEDIFRREHRLYQVDFLLRKYGFSGDEIAFGQDGNLSLNEEPKESWAKKHIELFPINANRASRKMLLRVPGLGPLTVKRILEHRRTSKIRSIENIGKVGVRLAKARRYLVF